MTLTYRGQIYTPSNNNATVTTQTFTYRGQTYQHHACDTIATPKSQLVYRGIPYNTTETCQSASLTLAFS